MAIKTFGAPLRIGSLDASPTGLSLIPADIYSCEEIEAWDHTTAEDFMPEQIVHVLTHWMDGYNADAHTPGCALAKKRFHEGLRARLFS